MTSVACERILKEVNSLSPQEIDALITHLLEERRKFEILGNSMIRWEALRGSAPYPLCGRDAQEWVTKSRRESDEGRDVK